ncbi:MAG: TetR/AcrR family transcriptional regulator [Spirochaetota bacterium]
MPAKGQRRKQQIIDTAKEMFMTQGFQSSHIGQICDSLNIARGTVYQYFGNKREILYAILDDVQDQIGDIFDADDLHEYMKTNPSKEAAFQFLSERLTKCIRSIISEPIVIKLIFKEINGIDDEVVIKIQKFVDNISRTFQKDLEEVRTRGHYRKIINPDVVTKMVIGGVLFFVHECDRQKKDPLSKENVSAIVDTILEGIIL